MCPSLPFTCRSSSHASALPPHQTTMLSLTVLRRSNESLLLNIYERDGFEETVVDRGMSWLESMVSQP